LRICKNIPVIEIKKKLISLIMKNYVILENQKILKSIEQKKPIGTHNELNELIMIENA
jgi:hypothetical protein